MTPINPVCTQTPSRARAIQSQIYPAACAPPSLLFAQPKFKHSQHTAGARVFIYQFISAASHWPAVLLQLICPLSLSLHAAAPPYYRTHTHTPKAHTYIETDTPWLLMVDGAQKLRPAGRGAALTNLYCSVTARAHNIQGLNSHVDRERAVDSHKRLYLFDMLDAVIIEAGTVVIWDDAGRMTLKFDFRPVIKCLTCGRWRRVHYELCVHDQN
jgi:hypothetical protein